MRLILSSSFLASFFLHLFLTPASAQDQHAYEDEVIRVVAEKVERIGSTSFNVCAHVLGDTPIRLIAVNLVFKDAWDSALTVSEILLFGDEGSKVFCNTWPLPAQARDFSKWELKNNILGLDCREGRLAIVHSTGPSERIPSSQLERIRRDIRRLPRYKDC